MKKLLIVLGLIFIFSVNANAGVFDGIFGSGGTGSGDMTKATYDTNSDSMVDADKINAGIDATKIGGGGVTSTEFGYIGDVTSAVQAQLNAKQATLTAQILGTLINSADAKTAPVDADYFGLMDSETGNILKKLSWAYVKSLLWASPTITGLPTFGNGATSSGYIGFLEDSTNGTKKVVLHGPEDVGASDLDIYLPAAAGTLKLTSEVEKIASFAWDGGGSAVATAGSKRCMLCPAAFTITGYNMVVDQDPGAGTTILNLDKDAIGDGTALATTDMDGAAHAYPPTVPDNKVSVNDTTITGWTTAVSANDMVCATVATNAVATWISLSIYGHR